MKESLYKQILSLIKDNQIRAKHFEEMEAEYSENKDYCNALIASVRMNECEKQIRDLKNLIE